MSTEFDVSTLKTLPRVGISYSYAGAQGSADLEAKGVIVATTGFAPEEAKYYEGVRKKGILVATTFPSGMSDRINSAEQRAADEQAGTGSQNSRTTLPPIIAVKHLMPTKARILMMLALTRTQNPSDIQAIFDSYLDSARNRCERSTFNLAETLPSV